jgi:adenosylhomocysteine nucleosidase
VIIGIVVALPEELTTLTDKHVGKGHCVFIAKQILVVYSGAGYQNAHAAAELLIAKGATHLVSWGCAAGLAKYLKAGDLVLPDTVIDGDNARIAVNTEWQKHCIQLLSISREVHTGSLLTTEQLVTSSKDKKQLNLKTGAVALDMESAAIAKVAQQRGLSFLVVRAIADSVNANLPQAVTHALNAQGDIELKKLVLFLALHPYELSGLIKLGLHFRAAKKTLQQVATQLPGIAALNTRIV